MPSDEAEPHATPAPRSEGRRPVRVYLDSQDFSRFADAAADRPREAADVPLLATLEAHAKAGRVQFFYSAMHLSELLQYEGGGRDLTLRKGAAVERLCGTQALIHPGRLVALQAVEAAQAYGLPLERRPLPAPVSSDNDWHPSLSVTLGDLRGHLDRALERRLASAGSNRHRRKAVLAQVRKAGAALFSDADIERIAQSFPFSPDVMRRAIRMAMEGRRPTADEERTFFREFAQPTRFVQIYFDREAGGKSLPNWMRGFGEQLREPIAQLREGLKPYANDPGLPDLVKTKLAAARLVLPRKLVSDFADEAASIGLPETSFNRVLDDEALLLSLPFCRLVADLLPPYIEANAGVHAGGRTARTSDGGDILHAIALPYCDLLRTDAYFGDLLMRTAPAEAHKVVRKLQELPARIDSLLAPAAV